MYVPRLMLPLAVVLLSSLSSWCLYSMFMFSVSLVNHFPHVSMSRLEVVILISHSELCIFSSDFFPCMPCSYSRIRVFADIYSETAQRYYKLATRIKPHSWLRKFTARSAPLTARKKTGAHIPSVCSSTSEPLGQTLGKMRHDESGRDL